MHRLITIGVSHYCEKARWALQRAGVPFREEAHAPVFHVFVAKRHGGGRTVPVLRTPCGEVLSDSTEILEHLDAQLPPESRLYPEECAAEVRELEELCDEALGPAVRRLVYGHVLYEKSFAPTLGQGVGLGERLCFRASLPLVRVAMKKAMNIRPEAVERSRLKIEQVLEQIEARLAEDGRYLVGERFSAADLSFAALVAPLVLPPEYGAPLPGVEALPAELAALVEAYRARPAGQFALRLYREERAGRVAA